MIATVVEMLNVFRPVATGAANVENLEGSRARVNRRFDGSPSQLLRKKAKFGDGFSFPGQSDEKVCLEIGRNIGIGEFRDRSGDLRICQRFVLRELSGQRLKHLESVGRGGEVC